ncbi:MAG: ADOP family duplicated permease [Terriglobales bacterium]
MRNSWRALRQHPLVSLVAVISLALAIGANTAVFSVWAALMRHTVPVEQPDRLLAVYNVAPSIPGTGYMPVSHLDFLDYARAGVFSAAYELHQAPVAFGTRGETVQVTTDLVSGNYFDVLGVRPTLGSVFHASQTRAAGAGALVVLSHEFFENRFHGSTAVVGSSITLNGVAFTVLGVAPADFSGTGALQGADLWAPMSMHKTLLPATLEAYFMARNAQFFSVVGRMRPGVTAAQAEAAVRLIGERLARQYPKTDSVLRATALPLPQASLDPNQRPIYSLALIIMLAVVGMVLLIACANVANLLLARAHARRREMAVRMALGASRKQIARQLLGESSLLGVAAAAGGLLVAAAGERLVWINRPQAMQAAAVHLRLSPGVLAFGLGMAILATLLFGLAPALLAARADPQQALRGAANGRGRRRHRVLLASEAGFSLAVLILAGLFLASLRHLQQAQPGFDAAHIASLHFDLAATGFVLTRPGAVDRLSSFEQTLLQRVRREPGVASATLASGTPMAAMSVQRGFMRFGEAQSEHPQMHVAEIESIAPGSFFRTMEIPLLAGRDFLPTDSASAPRVMIVNQTFAHETWPGQDPIGKRIVFHDEPAPTVVVGVVRDSVYTSLTEGPIAFAYLPLSQEPFAGLGLIVRSQGPPDAVLGEMRQAVRAVNPELPLTHVQPATVAIRRSLWAARMGAALLAILSALATLLAAIGVYGVAAYEVRQQWREMGIRMALGAGRSRVFASVLRRGMIPVLVGVAAGVAVAAVLGHLAASLLFGVGPANAGVLGGYAVLFAGIACLALLIPACTAMRADPAVILKELQ